MFVFKGVILIFFQFNGAGFLKRGIAKLNFVCEEAPKSAPSGVDEPGLRMVGTNGV